MFHVGLQVVEFAARHEVRGGPAGAQGEVGAVGWGTGVAADEDVLRGVDESDGAGVRGRLGPGLDVPVGGVDVGGVEVGACHVFGAFVLRGGYQGGRDGVVIVAAGGDGAEVPEAVVLEVTRTLAGDEVAVALGGVVF